MREIQREYEGRKNVDFGIIYTYTKPDTNSCVDSDGCEFYEELYKGKCTDRCEDGRVRREPDGVCGVSVETCHQLMAQWNQRKQEIVSQFQARIASSSNCHQVLRQQLQRAVTETERRINDRMGMCLRGGNAAGFNWNPADLIERNMGRQSEAINTACGAGFYEDTLNLLINPPAAPKRFLEDDNQ